MRTAPTPPHTLTSACSTGALKSPPHTVHHTHTAPAASHDCNDAAQPFHAPTTRTSGSSVDAANIAPRAQPTLHPTPTTRATTTEPHVVHVPCTRRGTTPPSRPCKTRPPPHEQRRPHQHSARRAHARRHQRQKTGDIAHRMPSPASRWGRCHRTFSRSGSSAVQSSSCRRSLQLAR